MPHQVTISLGGISATSRPLPHLEEACVDAEQRWVALYQAHPGSLDKSSYPYIAIEARGGSYGAAWHKRHWDEASNASVVRTLHANSLSLHEAADIYNLSWRMSVKVRGPKRAVQNPRKRKGVSLGGRPSHWSKPKWDVPRGSMGHRHEPSATRTTRRETPRGVVMIERCTCGARREVLAYGMENIYGEWEE